ncbi:MAG: endonuclease/exonuclease/phosphatase family protein [Roseovarius sp.]
MSPPSVRIASYNLQKCVGLDLRRRPGRSLKVINAIKADVMVLQEADKRLPPRPAALPHGQAQAEGWQILPFGPQGKHLGGSLGWHGNAMLTRDHVTVHETSHLELPGLEPRGAIRADLETSIGPLRVIGVHLGLVRRYRLLQLAAIRRAMEHWAQMPTLIVGDFNEWRSMAALEATAHGLSCLHTPPSFPAARPVARLDRMLITEQLHAHDMGVWAQRPAHVASDHLPVWADLCLS